MYLHTLTHMHRETHTCMVEYKTDPDVLPCYNLCCSCTGVLSLSFHSAGHTWNRVRVQTHSLPAAN